MGRYFERDKIMVNCTEAGRSHGGDHLKGLGMLARYFPCRVFLPQPDICTETASSVVSSYWDGFSRLLKYPMRERNLAPHGFDFLDFPFAF